MIAVGATTKARSQTKSGASSSQPKAPGLRWAPWNSTICPVAVFMTLRRSLRRLEVGHQLVHVRGRLADVVEGLHPRDGRVARRVRELLRREQLARLRVRVRVRELVRDELADLRAEDVVD